MKMRKICILVVVGVFGLLCLSYAQENVRKQLAEELLLLMEVDKTVAKTFDMIKQMQMNQLGSMKLPEELTKEASERIVSMQGEIMDIVAKELEWDKLKEDYISIYADVFTKEELEGIIAFYKTPVGQKFIKKQPELMQKSMEITQKQMTTIMPKIQKAMQDLKKTLKESREESEE